MFKLLIFSVGAFISVNSQDLYSCKDTKVMYNEMIEHGLLEYRCAAFLPRLKHRGELSGTARYYLENQNYGTGDCPEETEYSWLEWENLWDQLCCAQFGNETEARECVVDKPNEIYSPSGTPDWGRIEMIRLNVTEVSYALWDEIAKDIQNNPGKYDALFQRNEYADYEVKSYGYGVETFETPPIHHRVAFYLSDTEDGNLCDERYHDKTCDDFTTPPPPTTTTITTSPTTTTTITSPTTTTTITSPTTTTTITTSPTTTTTITTSPTTTTTITTSPTTTTTITTSPTTTTTITTSPTTTTTITTPTLPYCTDPTTETLCTDPTTVECTTGICIDPFSGIEPKKPTSGFLR